MITVLLLVTALNIFDLVAYFSTPQEVRAGTLYSMVPLVGGIYVYWRWQKDVRGRV